MIKNICMHFCPINVVVFTGKDCFAQDDVFDAKKQQLWNHFSKSDCLQGWEEFKTV